MSGMTWNEFKDAIDNKLKKRGIDGNEGIWFIDISFPSKDDIENEHITIGFDKHCGLAIS